MSPRDFVERIDTAAFDDAIEKMSQATVLFKRAKDLIAKYTDPLTEDWQGDGGSAFKRVYKKLKTELKDEEINLETFRDDLITAKQSYEEWDQGARDSLIGKEG